MRFLNIFYCIHPANESLFLNSLMLLLYLRITKPIVNPKKSPPKCPNISVFEGPDTDISDIMIITSTKLIKLPVCIIVCQFITKFDIRIPIKPKIAPDAPTEMSSFMTELKMKPPIPESKYNTENAILPIDDSTMNPTQNKEMELKKICIKLAWRKIGVTHLHIWYSYRILYAFLAPHSDNVWVLIPRNSLSFRVLKLIPTSIKKIIWFTPTNKNVIENTLNLGQRLYFNISQ